MTRVLVTGASGYIGSHTCVELLTNGFEVLGIDNLSNSSGVAIDRVRELSREMEFRAVDLRDRQAVSEVFAAFPVDAVLHFAGFKSVSDSMRDPLSYYDNNVMGSINLIGAMAEVGVRTIVFSSSCTVYGNPERIPVDESATLAPVSPYGRSKLMVEQVLRDVQAADPRWRVCLLRYFNPIGAHPSARLGEDPVGRPTNLMPPVMKVALGGAQYVSVFGGDYPTPDGTCVRDYLHVVDVATAHLNALEYAQGHDGVHAFNLGTGIGVSVLDLLAAASEAVGADIPARIVERRPGDAEQLYADNTLALAELGWKPTRGLADMCHDHWAFQRAHPSGYEGGAR